MWKYIQREHILYFELPYCTVLNVVVVNQEVKQNFMMQTSLQREPSLYFLYIVVCFISKGLVGV
jgi:hypothetical protein